ncbi:MAG: Amidase [Acidobacteriaceae bacterium]|nr:Amidase [Acidobacteriaceae bacterium]
MSKKTDTASLQEVSPRRHFLQTGVLATVGGSLLPALAGARGSKALAASSSTVKPFELDENTIADLQQKMRTGALTARSITEKYLSRIEEIDKHGPMLNSVIELNPDALTIASALDNEREAKKVRGPLHGIPVLIKDNIDTADRMQTTAGSLALLGSKPTRDSFVVQKLRDAGAVILGKTNLSEWANIRSSHSTSGWSGRGGQTLNPYALDRNPCGSSSGSGAAVSSNLCALAVGTETDGSVVCPASANGVVGIKPTVGLISRAGIIPIAHSQDTAGPLTRTVRDAAILLSALAGLDPRDNATNGSRGKPAADYTQFLDPNGLKGARIGVARKYLGFNDAVDELMDTLLDEMKRAGAVLVDPADLESHGKFDDTELTVLLYELKADLNSYLAGRPGAPKSLKEIIDFNQQNKDKEMPYFGQDMFIKAEAKGPLTSKEYLDALDANRRLSRQGGINGVMDKFHLDAIVAPTAGPAWINDWANGDHAVGGSSNAAAVAGYPDISVPAGFVFGLPVGISFFGRAWSEPTLLKIAYGFEQTIKPRKAPKFLTSVKF